MFALGNCKKSDQDGGLGGGACGGNYTGITRMKRACYPRDAQAFDRDPLRVSRNLVAKGGIEPPTHGFSVRCSTN